MEVHFHGRDVEISASFDIGITVRDALTACEILPSMVIVSYEGTVLPHSTKLTQDIKLLVTTISSGG